MMFSVITSLTAFGLFMTSVSAQSDTTPVTGLLGNATAATDNPAGVAYVATLTPGGQNHNVQGSVLALTSSNNTGVNFQISLSGLPSEGGPFIYHIHNDRISSDGNCTSAGAHVDPFQRGEAPACDSTMPETCQVGDLSGKHGKVQIESFSANYVDVYVSTVTGSPAFVGNRSVVVHFANKTRIACANFEVYSNSTTASNMTGSTNTTGSASGSGANVSATSTSKASGAGGASSSSTASLSTGAGTQLMANFGLIVLLGCLAMAM